MCSVKTRPKPGLASMRSRSAAGIRVAAGWYSNRTAEVVELTSKEAYPTHGDFAETAPDGSGGPWHASRLSGCLEQTHPFRRGLAAQSRRDGPLDMRRR